MLRFSSYSILSTPLPDGSYVLMNGLSGAVDLLPPWMGQLLERVLLHREHALEAELLASLEPETVESFEQRGHLTRLSPEEEKQLLRLVADASHSAAASKPAFLIVPNLDCNYRCTYCFERPLQNSLYQIHSPAHAQRPSTNIVMTRHQVDAAYRAIGEIQQQAGSQRGGQLILYGGEPLDRDNYPIVRYIVSRGLEEGFYFAAVTNGHDLDAYLGLLGPGLIEQLQITFDGPKAIHDRRRIHRGHESSFDKIVANIHRVLAETGAEVQLRVHVAPDTLSCFGELINFFNQQGWINNPRVVIYASTVYAKDENGRVRSTVTNRRLAEELAQLSRTHANVYTCPPAYHASAALRPVFTEGNRFQLRGVYCSANTALYIFAPDGAIYSCWESIGKECSRIGHYDGPAGLVIDAERAALWFHRSVATVEECQRCPYALVCGGGCAQYAQYNTGSLYKPYCDHFQDVFRLTLAENVEFFLANGGPKLGALEAVVRE